MQTGRQETGGQEETAGPTVETERVEPGSLGIRQPRSWATWHLAAVALVALVVGMAVGYSGKKTSSSTADAPLFKPGPAPTATAGGNGATTSTATSPTTTTTTAAPAAAPAPTAVLMANTQSHGSADLPAFTAAGPWNVGWHFRCFGTPTGSGTFTVTVVTDPSGDTGPTPAVDQTGREAQGVAPQTATGKLHLRVTAGDACQWAVKVTG